MNVLLRYMHILRVIPHTPNAALPTHAPTHKLALATCLPKRKKEVGTLHATNSIACLQIDDKLLYTDTYLTLIHL